MNKVLRTISEIGIVPVISIDDAANAVPLARALVAGGLPAAEVTFRTSAAEDTIRIMTTEVPEMLVGAGTVLTPEQLDRALEAGAQFIVSPGFNPDMVRYGLSKGALMIPGTATGGEMEQAMAMGLEVVKFFPAEQNGGLAKLKALAGPYQTLKWMPTGGISASNVASYLSLPQVAACGGTWMAAKELIAGEKWGEITALCKQAVKTMLGFSLAHVGVNCSHAAEAEKTAQTLCALFGLEYRPGNGSVFAGNAVECMKTPGLGKNGHIAILTNSLDRAVCHLKRQGIEFNESTHTSKAIYLKNEIGGFAVHLLQKS